MRERQPISLGERWRREANRGVDDKRLQIALSTLPSVRKPAVRVHPGAIHAEMEGAMGAIHEVSIHVPLLPQKIWPQVARRLRRSPSVMEALSQGRVPRAFDRLVARVAGESVFPESRRVTSACTCGAPEQACRHVLALHELFARRLEERPWELLVLRGVDLHHLLERARSTDAGEGLPRLAFDAREEPVLFPEGEEGDLDFVLSSGQVRDLVGLRPAEHYEVVAEAIARYAAGGDAGER